MKNSTRKRILSFIFCILAVVPFFLADPGQCEMPQKVAVCPFEMNAAEDLSFLQKGLFSMLSSRLADPGKVEILNRETIDKALENAQSTPSTQGPLNESKATLIGKEIGVDYILFGSLTMFGNSVSLDTTMVDISGVKPVLTFSRQADQPGAVITELDKIASEINFKMFSRKPEEFIPQTQYAQQPQQYQPGAYASPLTNYRVLLATNDEIVGVSTGDVDGDKKNEVVIIFKQAIEILEDNQNGQLVSVKRIEDGQYVDIVGVDVADINNNGKAEIFITRFHRENGYLKSHALEYEGGEYKNISGDLPWYMRVVKAEGMRHELYGQKSGRLGPYRGRDVFKIMWENNTYVSDQKLLVPEGFSVMSMTAVSDADDVSGRRLFTDKHGRLTIINENGAVEWSGEEGYGGSKLFYEFKEIDKIIQDVSDGKGTYFQPRSLVFDFKSDGKKEVFAIKNEDAAGNLFSGYKHFKKGSIEMLTWSEMGLLSEHAPKKIPGQLTDIAIDDVDHNGKKELLVSFIKKRNNFSPKKSKSMIVAYDLE